jgi:chemotaxis protein MotB
MAKKKKKVAGGGGAPDWLVTFADLMSLLVCFFVLIISFSIQDKQKLQVVAGSMKEAFGVKEDSRKAGLIELEGAPVRDYMKQVALIEQENDTDFSSERHAQRRKQGPEANTHDVEKADIERPRQFATAAASLRQAWQEMPEISELSENILVEETEDGLNIQLMDQDGRSMFPEGSRYPVETTRLLLSRMAPILRKLPHRIQITGHTTTGPTQTDPFNTGWDLSSERANSVRQILQQYGIPSEQFHSVIGKSDTDPLFPNDPYLAANRRVSILLMAEEPPVPSDHRL